MEVTAAPNDNASHSVQIYTDITGEWASNDWARNITWSKTVLNNTLHVHEVSLLNQTLYGEVQDSTTYGSVVYATDMVRRFYKSHAHSDADIDTSLSLHRARIPLT